METQYHKYYKPDRSLKNVWAVLQFKRHTTLILSCKDCPMGVSPRRSWYGFAVVYPCAFLAFLLWNFWGRSVLDGLLPEGWGRLPRAAISLLIFLPVFFALAAVCTLLSFCVTKWVPADPPEIVDGKIMRS